MILYFDAFAGASGDMILGALLDAGVDLDAVQRELQKLEISGYELKRERVTRRGIAATRFQVLLEGGADPDAPPRHGAGHVRGHEHDYDHHGDHGPHGHHAPARPLRKILDLIDRSALAGPVKALSRRIFERLGEAEARVHGVSPADVHLHEVGAVDAIVDICGAAVALHLLGMPECHASPLHVGQGFVETAHGRYPVPAPATAYLIEGVPSYATDVEGELLTPTGAAVLTTVCRAFGPRPPMRIRATGYGAGKHDRVIPNVLRVHLGDPVTAEFGTGVPAPAGAAGAGGPGPGWALERVVLLETNIDDLNPQVYPHLLERLLEGGALDAWLTPAHMKKGRPGVLLHVLARREEADALAAIVFAETTTIGLRRSEVERWVLPREWVTVETPYGPVQVKVARLGGRVVNAMPEYEDCRAAAREHGVPLRRVWEQALAAAARLVRDGAGDGA